MVERILVVQLRQLGDILLTTPCLKALKQTWPKARIAFLSHSMGEMVLAGCPYIDQHYVYGSDWTFAQEVALARKLRQEKFDLVFDFMGNPRSAAYSLFSGAPKRLAFKSARSFAYTNTIAHPKDPIYIVREKFMLLAAAGVNAAEERLVLPWTASDLQPWLNFLRLAPEVQAKPLRVVLSPTHRRAVRRWPLASYARIAEHLTVNWGAACIWLWGPGEEAVTHEAMSLCREKTWLAPPTTFRQMAALLANVDLFIGNSNGPSHVAVAANTPSLQLHGPTFATSWSPMTDRHRGIQAEAVGSGPINIAEISVDDVWASLQSMRHLVEAEARKRAKPRLNWEDGAQNGVSCKSSTGDES